MPDNAVTIDHYVIAVTDWERSNQFYREVLRGEVIPRGPGYVYRFGSQFLSVHGPGVDVQATSKHFVARVPVQPGNSDLCFVWPEPIEAAIAHLERARVQVENGPFEAVGPLGRRGRHIYLRDPDGSLIELVSLRVTPPARRICGSRIPGVTGKRVHIAYHVVWRVVSLSA